MNFIVGEDSFLGYVAERPAWLRLRLGVLVYYKKK